MASFYLSHLCKGPVSTHRHILRSWAQDFNLCIGVGGHSSAPNETQRLRRAQPG